MSICIHDRHLCTQQMNSIFSSAYLKQCTGYLIDAHEMNANDELRKTHFFGVFQFKDRMHRSKSCLELISDVFQCQLKIIMYFSFDFSYTLETDCTLLNHFIYKRIISLENLSYVTFFSYPFKSLDHALCRQLFRSDSSSTFLSQYPSHSK